ncbi:MAG: hypothetical protein A2Z88_04285 [Omnitrophica WOR_2 bacterium GWA2_47_8]|nr:MAG: hypothetical protein A2Z88_04285 [Omnitrophica WOR_2 bacterium GWA2_47_8]
MTFGNNLPLLSGSVPPATKPLILRRFSKLLCFSTLFLIFAGGLVTSTGSGLAVPDWPLSYGSLFPPMVGGVFYEHGHRMIAATVGFLTLIFTVLVAVWEQKQWVKWLAWSALAAVILQGVLGGITVLLFLPDLVSVAHGVLAQTFFILTIILAYSQSLERTQREVINPSASSKNMLKFLLLFAGLIYCQLIVGAVMRHTASGLAIPDFPMMGGRWLPTFDSSMLTDINEKRFLMNLDPVVMGQVVIHFVHRLGACLILILGVILNRLVFMHCARERQITSLFYLLDFLVVLQIALGAMVILTAKNPYLTTLHVAIGAAILGLSVLILLRAVPLTLSETRKALA